MSNIHKRNDFIGNILFYIVKSYTSKSNDPLLVIKNSALFFGKTFFKIDSEKNIMFESLDERGQSISLPIELGLSYNSFHYFLKHLSEFGILCVKKITTHNLHDEIQLSLTILYNPITMLSFIDESLFYKFLLSEKYRELGKLQVIFNITLIHENYTFGDLPKKLLSDCIYGEYIDELDFWFGVDLKACPYDMFCLDWVVDYCQIYQKNYWKEDQVNFNVEHTFKYLLDGNDTSLIRPLKFKESRNTEKTTCTICLELMGEQDICFQTTCKHYFHKDCIIMFLSNYYNNLFRSCLEGRNLTLEHDIDGNVLQGASYEYSCPNCKNECFKLTCKIGDKNICEILNPENCIFEI